MNSADADTTTLAPVAAVHGREATGRNPEIAKVQECAVFDVLRFLLAFTVLLTHMGLLAWDQAGNLAVQVFFALSGWLIGSILCNTKAPELSRFYFNRATRIWIPYFVTVCVLYSMSILRADVLPLSSRWHEFLIYDLTFTHNWFSLLPSAEVALRQMPLQATGNHFWSIAVEEQFYLVAPVIVTLLPFGRKPATWLGIAAIALFTRSWYGSVSLGVLAAVVAYAYPAFHLKPLVRALFAAVIIAASVGMWISPGDYEYFAPLFSVAVVVLCSVPSIRNGVTRWIGGISFPLYLNAWMGVFAFHFVAKRMGFAPGWLYQILLALAAVGGAVASYHLVDRIVMANRNRYYSRRLGWVLASLAYLLLTTGILYGRHEISQREAPHAD
jgi:peptidoglycan/LPS O-acetylase OafA/YrhL